MGWNLESLATGFERHVIIDTDEVILGLFEQSAVARVGARGHVRFLRAPNPSNRVVVGASAARTLEPCGTLFGLLGKELSFVHKRSVHESP